MRIATLNVQNMRLRDTAGRARLDGARDGDNPSDSGADAARLDRIDRHLTAALIKAADADILALQEVFDQQTLDHFHDRFLLPTGAAPYPHRICLPGNDGRGLDVALLSRLEPDTVTGHADLTPDQAAIDPAPGLPPDRPVFRRDCLMVDFPGLTLFVCHFKAPWPDPAATWPVRRAEAQAVRHLIQTRFKDPAAARWLVLGDLNDPRAPPPGHARAIAPLLPPFSVNLVDRLPEPDRWSWFQPHEGVYAAPDKLLASPALAAQNPDAVPHILRQGLGFEAARYAGPHLTGTGLHRPHASDHALLAVNLV